MSSSPRSFKVSKIRNASELSETHSITRIRESRYSTQRTSRGLRPRNRYVLSPRYPVTLDQCVANPVMASDTVAFRRPHRGSQVGRAEKIVV